jgi:hypothetical protein
MGDGSHLQIDTLPSSRAVVVKQSASHFILESYEIIIYYMAICTLEHITVPAEIQVPIQSHELQTAQLPKLFQICRSG